MSEFIYFCLFHQMDNQAQDKSLRRCHVEGSWLKSSPCLVILLIRFVLVIWNPVLLAPILMTVKACIRSLHYAARYRCHVLALLGWVCSSLVTRYLSKHIERTKCYCSCRPWWSKFISKAKRWSAGMGTFSSQILMVWAYMYFIHSLL